jgi:hypothetical protein
LRDTIPFVQASCGVHCRPDDPFQAGDKDGIDDGQKTLSCSLSVRLRLWQGDDKALEWYRASDMWCMRVKTIALRRNQGCKGC